MFRFKWSSRVNLARININHVHHDLQLLFSISAVLQQPHVQRKDNEKIKSSLSVSLYAVSIELFSIYIHKHTYLYTYMYNVFAHEWMISSNLARPSCCHKPCGILNLTKMLLIVEHSDPFAMAVFIYSNIAFCFARQVIIEHPSIHNAPLRWAGPAWQKSISFLAFQMT